MGRREEAENRHLNDLDAKETRYEIDVRAAHHAKRRGDYRIEALRAASRVVSGTYAKTIDEIERPVLIDIPATTLGLAERFAKWLETGDEHDIPKEAETWPPDYMPVKWVSEDELREIYPDSEPD